MPRAWASFADSVRLVSSVSGGGVGAAYFLNEYPPSSGFDPRADFEAVRQNATELEPARGWMGICSTGTSDDPTSHGRSACSTIAASLSSGHGGAP